MEGSLNSYRTGKSLKDCKILVSHTIISAAKKAYFSRNLCDDAYLWSLFSFRWREFHASGLKGPIPLNISLLTKLKRLWVKVSSLQLLDCTILYSLQPVLSFGFNSCSRLYLFMSLGGLAICKDQSRTFRCWRTWEALNFCMLISRIQKSCSLSFLVYVNATLFYMLGSWGTATFLERYLRICGPRKAWPQCKQSFCYFYLFIYVTGYKLW